MTKIPPIITSFDVNRVNNAQLMRDVNLLGYLERGDYTLDATYEWGRFWKLWRPENMVTNDLNPECPTDHHWDFTNLPVDNGVFDATVLDGPYKLNGTSTGKGASALDKRYGVAVPAHWRDRHRLINAGIQECVRVTRTGGMVFVKCQDSVCLTKVRWQTREFAGTAEDAGCRLVDMLHVYGSRKQPRDGTPEQSQDHSRRNYSSLLVLRKEAS